MKRTSKYAIQKENQHVWDNTRMPPQEPTQRQRPLAEIIRGAILRSNGFDRWARDYPDRVRPYKGHKTWVSFWLPVEVYVGPRC